jgi:hypothetical protein
MEIGGLLGRARCSADVIADGALVTRRERGFHYIFN